MLAKGLHRVFLVNRIFQICISLSLQLHVTTQIKSKQESIMKGIITLLLLISGIGILYCQTTPDWMWAESAGGTGADCGYGITIDNSGNSYIIGSFTGTATFGTTTLISSGLSDIFIAKLNASGSYLWAIKAGGSANDCGFGITIDNSGNLLVTGKFALTAAFGTTNLTSNGSLDLFIAKLDSDGNWLWAASTGGASSDGSYSIDSDNDGNGYITGSIKGTVLFGTTSITTQNFGNDAFIAKFNHDGSWLWARNAQGDYDDCGRSIAIDNNGNCYATGNFSYVTSFGTTSLTNNINPSIFVTKLDTNGNWLLAKQAGGTLDDYGYGITVDVSGNCYVTGSYYSYADFGTIHLENPDNGQLDDVFVAKLDTNGNWLWAKQAGGHNIDHGTGITTDSDANCYVTGYFGVSATFGTTDINGAGWNDIFVSKLDTNGNWQWIKTAGGIHHDQANGIISDSDGNCYVTGFFQDIATYDTSSISCMGGDDIFVAKLSSDGTFIDDEVTYSNDNISKLYAAYPNPMHKDNTSTIKADITPYDSGCITIYNLKGQVLESHKLASGSHSISFSSKELASGIYFYRLRTASVNEVKKLIILKD
jgi:hypothetical protein